MSRPNPTQDQIDAWLAEWQEVLRLRDWKVTASIVRGRNMTRENAEGCIPYQLTKKRATIELLDLIDEPAGYDFPIDHELSCVHELLHLHFAPFFAADDSPENTAQEIAIELIAEALVTLKRRANPPSRDNSSD